MRPTISKMIIALTLAFPSAALAQEVQFRLGAHFPNADSDFWDKTRQSFTLEKSDLYEGVVGGGFRTPLSDTMSIGFDISASRSENTSSDRDYVDSRGLPVLHDTNFSLVPMMVDLRYYPGGGRDGGGDDRDGGRHHRRRHGGRDAGFYLGAGLGGVAWQYEEIGDFVDPASEEVFYDRYQDEGFALAAHALAGVDVPMGSDWSLFVEGRYLWAEDELEGPFTGLGTIDLSGTSLAVGATYRF